MKENKISAKSKIFRKNKQRNNVSGMNGISCSTSISRWTGNEYQNWMVNFDLDKKRFHKSFSVNKYGFVEAFNMAVVYRALLVREEQAKKY